MSLALADLQALRSKITWIRTLMVKSHILRTVIADDKERNHQIHEVTGIPKIPNTPVCASIMDMNNGEEEEFKNYPHFFKDLSNPKLEFIEYIDTKQTTTTTNH
jgi:hypothetical protein